MSALAAFSIDDLSTLDKVHSGEPEKYHPTNLFLNPYVEILEARSRLRH